MVAESRGRHAESGGVLPDYPVKVRACVGERKPRPVL